MSPFEYMQDGKGKKNLRIAVCATSTAPVREPACRGHTHRQTDRQAGRHEADALRLITSRTPYRINATGVGVVYLATAVIQSRTLAVQR